MRVFVTGATGHIGSALVPDLLEAGHTVLGLARSESAAAALEASGAQALRGSLDDLDVLRQGAAAADGVVHLAFRHDLSFSGDMAGAAATDLRAINTIGDALDGTHKPFVGTSGTLLLAFAAPGRLGTESDALESGPRVDAENAVVALAQRGVRSSVVRLAPTVHSALDRHGFVPQLIRMAREHGVSPYVDDGSNRWPAVHTLDAARLFRLALESAPAGSRLHGAADQGVPFRDIATLIGRHLNVPVDSVTREQAPAHFEWLSSFVPLDNPTSSALTQALVGWRPVHPGLLADLEQGHYFEAAISASGAR
jgi:nucleoside-diphosphate-sugar epimerase